MSCDTAHVQIARSAEEVFAFMADAEKLSLWSFGTWSVEIDEAGLIRGESIKDGAAIHLRIVPYPSVNLIDYVIGQDPDNLVPRIFARVVPGRALGRSDDECVLTLTAVRPDTMDDESWSNLTAAHAFEIGLIKAAVETGYDHRQRK